MDVEVLSEREFEGGWSFELRFGDGDGGGVTRTLRLAWADYDLWSNDGGDPPHAVATAVAVFLLSRITPSDFPATLDAATARRHFSDADDEIPKLIRS